MASTTRFISKSAFDPYYDFSSYIDDTEINPCILAAQYKYVRGILGVTIYEALQTAVANSSTDADDDALIAALTPYLVFMSLSVYAERANIKSTEMGLRNLNEKESVKVDPKQMQLQVESFKFDAMSHESDLRIFLEANKTTYNWTECPPAQRFLPNLSWIKKTQTNRR